MDHMSRKLDARRIEAVDPEVVAILRTKLPHEKIAMASDAFEAVRYLLQVQVTREHPDWPNNEVNREVARRIARERDEVCPRRP
jgi:hypothetical protein